MAVNVELLGLLFDKARLPNRFKAGLVISYVVFKGFDIDGKIRRAMQRDRNV